MSVTRISYRYAKSLLDLAVNEKNLDNVLKDMSSLFDASKNRDFHLMLKSPIINTTKKKDIVQSIFGESFDKMSMGFVNLILTKGREEHLTEISEEFLKQYKKLKKISSAIVTSAHELSDEALAKIKTKLLASNLTDESVEITTNVDPALIGGFIIEIGDKLYDASVAHKLNKLKKEFVGNSYNASN